MVSSHLLFFFNKTSIFRCYITFNKEVNNNEEKNFSNFVDICNGNK